MARKNKVWGLLVEFDNVDDLVHAAHKVRDEGYSRWDCHTPFPVHGLNDAMGLKLTALPIFVFGAGATGAVIGLVMQWWMNAIDYPIIISGKPMFSLPANIPIIFELTILLAALTAFAGMLALNGLPQHSHPLFTVERFSRVTNDRFFIVIESKDPIFHPVRTREFLDSLEGKLDEVEAVEQE